MSKSSSDRHGRVAIILHWVSALFVSGLRSAGFQAGGITGPVAKASLLRILAPVGTLVPVLTLARIA
jgi:cytochrome b561